MCWTQNAIVRALLLDGSVARHAFDKASSQGKIILSLPVLEEMNEVLSRKRFDKYLMEEERMRFLAALVKEAEIINVTETITDCRDPKDNKFLELAVSGNAHCIVSRDKDWLVLNPFRGIPILPPESFLQDF